MDITIITKPFQLYIYGFGRMASNKDFTGTAFQLSGKMWEIVKTKDIKNKGKNIWVYETNDRVFAGVELENSIEENNTGLEKKHIHLNHYAYYKHVGSYQLIKQIGQQMNNELSQQGYEVILPYVEIYGHWTNDENVLETELLMCLK